MEKTIEMKGVDLSSFFGPADTNLKLIESLFSSKIVARGNLIKIIGDEAEVNTISQIFHEMASALNEKGTLELSDVETLLTFNSSAISSQNTKPKYIIHYGRKGSIAARTKGQERYVEIARKNDIVFSTGPAGTGKTFLAVAFAVAALQNREVEKIILCRPAVEAGESLGFLPGDLKEKIDPYLRPLYDALGEILDIEKLKPLLFNNTIEIVPLAYMRGRTLNNAFMILDEAQNASTIQMKMFLTRLGVNSKTIITGDVTQTDLPKKIESGLIQVLNLLKDIEGVGFCNLSSSDIVRHKLVKDIIQAYDNKKN